MRSHSVVARQNGADYSPAMRGISLEQVFVLFLAAGCQIASGAAGLEWERQPDSLALRLDGQTVWRFNYGTHETKPSFHPLAVAGGPVLSCYRPTDHPWHRGL